VAAGCGNDTKPVPVACLEGAKPMRAALADAPRAVRLEDGTKLSECFTRAANPAQIQQVGATFIEVAERLAPQARKNPNGAAATQLGYLMGAVRNGADGTQGIHYEAQRRIEQELIGVDTEAPAFVSGEKAGRRSG
jgi:hypothetical protein